MKLINVLTACVFVVSCDANSDRHEEHGPVAKLCFVPFDASTSAPMTIANFSVSCADIGDLGIHDERLADILQMIKVSRPGSFLDGGIRVRISRPDSPDIFIDDAGGVLSGESRTKLGGSDFSKLRKTVTKIAKEKGILGID